MAVYQVSVVFEAEYEERATELAELISSHGKYSQENDWISNAKISFVRFEKEAEDVAAE